jgi:hypothetical protein
MCVGQSVILIRRGATVNEDNGMMMPDEDFGLLTDEALNALADELFRALGAEEERFDEMDDN